MTPERKEQAQIAVDMIVHGCAALVLIAAAADENDDDDMATMVSSLEEVTDAMRMLLDAARGRVGGRRIN